MTMRPDRNDTQSAAVRGHMGRQPCADRGGLLTTGRVSLTVILSGASLTMLSNATENVNTGGLMRPAFSMAKVGDSRQSWGQHLCPKDIMC